MKIGFADVLVGIAAISGAIPIYIVVMPLIAVSLATRLIRGGSMNLEIGGKA